MTRAGRLLLATPLMLFLACQDQVVDPNSTAAEPLFAKGGKPGKPNDPPAADTANPAIAYQAGTAVPGGFGTAIWVMDADGSNATELCDCDSAGSGCITWGGWSPTWSPDGTSIAYYVSSDNSLRAMDIELDADGQPIATNRRTLALGEPYHPAWSPLGDMIAFDDWGDSVFTVPASGGERAFVVNGSVPAWSPDATRLAFKGSGESLLVLTFATGVIDTLIQPGQFLHLYDLDWSRNGDRIAFSGGHTGWAIDFATYVLDLTTGQYPMLTDLGRMPTWSPDDSELLLQGKKNKKKPSYDGLVVVDAITGEEIRRFGDGKMPNPDWRRCLPGPGCGPGN